MADTMGAGPLDYFPCRYGAGTRAFRGPGSDMAGTFVACIGGTETFGPFVPRPFPALLQRDRGRPVVNLGIRQAGLSLIETDATVGEAMARAAVCVIQPPGPQALSNPFYRVHPRRNDRFLRPTDRLCRLYPDLDLTSVHFAGHLVRLLHETDPERFTLVARALRHAWRQRLGGLLGRVQGRAVLLWLDRAQDSGPGIVTEGDRASLSARAQATVRVDLPVEAEPTRGMVFDAADRLAARHSLSPAAHARIAEALEPVLAGQQGRADARKNGARHL